MPSRALTFALALSVCAPAFAQEGVVREHVPEPPQKEPQLTRLPQLIESRPAEYPPEKLSAGVSADVVTSIDIAADGRVDRVEIERSAGPDFDAAALSAIAGYRFSPAEVDGKPAPVRIRYVYHFVIQQQRRQVTEEAPEDPDAGVVAGEVLEMGTRRPIPGAELIIKKLGKTAIADARGKFELKVSPGKHEVDASAPGFAEGFARAPLERHGRVEVTLYLRRTEVGELSATVLGEKPQEAPTRRSLTREELMNVPGSLNDPIRAVQNLPGLARAPFLSGALLVRGSSPADTGIYFDGNKIPVLYHFLGGPSVISEELLDRVDFYPGGFGAYYGRNLTGVLDVKSHRGDQQGFHGSASVDLLQATAFLEGPIDKDTRFAVAARRSYIDAFLRFVQPSSAENGTTSIVPVYYDYQARLDHRLQNGDELALLAFGSDDKLAVVQKGGTRNNDIAVDTHTGFHRVQLSWKRQLSSDVTVSAAPVLGYTTQSFSAAGAGPSTFALQQSGSILDWSVGLRSDLRWKPSDSFELRSGVDLLFDRYDYRADIQSTLDVRNLGLPITEQQQFSRVQPFWQIGEYVEGEYKIGKFSITPGLRIDEIDWRGNTTGSIDPRLWARYELSDSTAIKAYSGIYHEPPSPLQIDANLGNPQLGLAWAAQFGVGVEQKFAELWNLSVEIFHNHREALVSRVPAVARADGTVYNPIYDNVGIGHAYGLEVLLRREISSKFYGWLAYTLSRAQIVAKPGDPWRAFAFDQPHILTLLAGYRPSVGWELSSRYRLVSGNPTSPITGAVFDADSGNYTPTTGIFGDARAPLFSQLDARAQYTWTFTTWQLQLYLDVQNVLNTKNPEFTLHDYRFRETGYIDGLPILPTLGIKGKW